jgi:hypothetical protein
VKIARPVAGETESASYVFEPTGIKRQRGISVMNPVMMFETVEKGSGMIDRRGTACILRDPTGLGADIGGVARALAAVAYPAYPAVGSRMGQRRNDFQREISPGAEA